jgi:hypothetical protein
LSGTATSASSNGTVLIDSGATFVTDGVLPGATVLNYTDNSVSSIISVDSETQLSLYALDDGTDNDWDISDAYKIWNITQFDIAGGNLVAVDENGFSTTAILSTFGNEILKTSSSSATFTEQEAIQYSSFGNGITVDIVNGTAGTVYPLGTPEFPSNNMVDANVIAISRGFDTFFIKSDLTLTSVDFSDGRVFQGRSASSITITINPGANVINCEFFNATILGTLDGNNTLKQCIITDLDYVNGIIEDSILNAGTITLFPAGSTLHILNCFSGIPGTGTPVVDMGTSGQSLAMRNYNGGIKIINKSGAEAISIDLNSGQVILDSTITNGEIVIRGIGKLTDNSIGATVNKDDLLNRESLTEPNWDTIWVDDSIGTAGTSFPFGTASNPVDNLVDAKTIADRIGVTQFRIRGDFTLVDDFSGYSFFSFNSSFSSLDLNDQLTTNTLFENIKIDGQQNASSTAVFKDCSIKSGVTNAQGQYHNCTLLGSLTVAPGILNQTVFEDCSAGGTFGAIINAQASSLIVGTGLAGIWTVNGVDAGPPPTIVQLEFNTGSVTLSSSCIGGVVILAGVVDVIDNSGSACIVTRDAQMQTSALTQAQMDVVYIDTVSGSAGTSWPLGVRSNPVDNISDAKTIADLLGIRRFNIRGALLLEQAYREYSFEGDVPLASVIYVDGQDIDFSSFKKCKLSGSSTGHFVATDCVFESGYTNMDADLVCCELKGNFVALSGETINGDRCTASSSAAFNLNGDGNLNMNNFSGVASITNATDASCDINFTGSYVATLENTLTAGNATMAGVGVLNDNSNGMTVTNKTLPATVWNEPTETDVTVGEAVKVLLATLAGEATGGGTSTIEFKNPAGDATRVTMTVDNDGNRSAINLNV